MKSNLFAPVAFATVLSWYVVMPAWAAEESSDVLEEVIVAATKEAHELSKVPISISAFTQDTMDARAIKSINDIVAQTPGLDLGDQGSNGVGDRIPRY
jgi:iron complex outermembrane recepter protein